MEKQKQNKELNSDVKFGLKSFLTIIFILLAINIFVGILTFIIPAGRYLVDAEGKILPNNFEFLDTTTRLPVWRWFTAPFEALLFGEGNFNIIQIIAVLLVLGGTFKVLDKTGGLYAVVQIIVNKFHSKRYLAIWVITLVMMLLSSCFGLQEELLILFPIFLSFSKAMNWSKVQAVSFVLITTGVGFTTAMFNPFTIGIASSLAGITILDGLWYRFVIFCILYVLTSLFLVWRAKLDEKRSTNEQNSEIFVELSNEEKQSYNEKAKSIITLFLTVLAVTVVSSAVPFIADLGISMILIALTFVVGTIIIGNKYLHGVKPTMKHFLDGVVDLAPSIAIILLAFSVKYIADKGNILHTLFYYFRNFTTGKSPYLTIILIYVMILVFEFFIPGSSAKALLLIPLLTIAPIPNIGVNVIMLAFLFGDGYTNVLYPTCGTLVIGLSLAEVGYAEWLKKTAVFQILLFVISSAFLIFAVFIGL